MADDRSRTRKPKEIPPGKCGFKGCSEERIGGVWEDDGSYMCPEHANLLLDIRLSLL